MALWQRMHFGTWCTVTHISGKCNFLVFWLHTFPMNQKVHKLRALLLNWFSTLSFTGTSNL